MIISFKYPIAAIVATNALLVWQVITVEKTRIAAGIKYPQREHQTQPVVYNALIVELVALPVYAEKEEAAKSKQAMIFNCAQRES